MRWRTLAVPALFAWATGCQAEPRSFLDADTDPAVTAARTVEAAVARSQSPEIEPPKKPPLKTFLDQPPERLDKGDKGFVKARIQATVNGTPILEEEVMEASYPLIMSLPKNMPAPERDKQLALIYSKQLDELINYELLLQDAVQKLSKSGQQALDKLKQAAGREFDQVMRKKRIDMGVKTEEEFKKVLESHQVSLEGMRRQYERTFLAKEYLRYLVSSRLDDAVGHRQIRDYYDQHPEEFIAFDNVDWMDLFIDPSNSRYKGNREEARAFARQVVVLLRQGADFKQFLEYDDGDSKRRDGHGTGHRRGEIQPTEVEELLFRLKDGEVAEVAELPGGFHVIKVIKREFAGPRPFNEKVQGEIRDKLRNDIGGREIQAIVRDLRIRGVIEIADTAK